MGVTPDQVGGMVGFGRELGGFVPAAVSGETQAACLPL